MLRLQRTLDSIATGLLCKVERLISRLHQGCDTNFARNVGKCDTEAATDLKLPAFETHGRTDNGLTQALAQHARLFPVAVRKHDKEFITAKSTNMIVGAYICAEAMAGLLNDRVSCSMSKAIVYALKFIQVHHNDGKLSAFPSRSGEFLCQGFENLAPIPHPSERVTCRPVS